MEELRIAAERHDCQAVIALFAPDIIVRSPITQRIRFEGIASVRELFVHVFDQIHDIRFYETVGEGQPNQVIFWTGWVGDQYLEEANLLRLDAQGRIREMTVFMRPVPGLLALAAGLVPLLAGRRGWSRVAVIRVALRTFSAVYRVCEPVLVRLMGVGVPVPPPMRCVTPPAALPASPPSAPPASAPGPASSRWNQTTES